MQTVPSNASTPQYLCTVAAKRCALDEAHLRHFVSGNRLHVCRMEHYKRLKEQQKSTLALQKLQQKKIQQDLENAAIQQCVLKLQEYKLQLEIFSMESNVLKAAGVQPLLQSIVLLMMMDSLIMNIPQNIPVSTAVSAVIQSDHPPVVLPVQENELQEVLVFSDVDQIHANILCAVTRNKDIVQMLTTVWCKPFSGTIQQFIKENAHIIMLLSAMEDIESVSQQL